MQQGGVNSLEGNTTFSSPKNSQDNFECIHLGPWELGAGETSNSTVNYNRNVRKELLQPNQLRRGRAMNKYKPAGAFVGHEENQGA